MAETKEKAPAKTHAEIVKAQVKHRGHSRKSSGFGGGTDGNGTPEAAKVQGKTIAFFKAEALKIHAAWRRYSNKIKWEDYKPKLVQRASEIAASEGKDN